MSISLAVKYRPKTWEEVSEQSIMIKILKQQLATNNLRNAYLFCGASGTGKAQPLTSKVYTPDGYKLMRDIEVNDSVIDGEGKLTKVLATYPQGNRDIYTIKLSDGTSFEVADNHLNTVYRNNLSTHTIEYLTLNTLELKQLLESKRAKDRYPLFIPTPIINCWQDSNIDIDPYLLGCLIGDGSLHNGCSISSSDKEILDSLNNILDRDFDMRLKYIDQYDYGIVSKYDYKYHFKFDNKDFFSVRAIQNYLMQKGYPRMDGKTLIHVAQNTAPQILKRYPELRDAISVKINSKKPVWNSKSFRKLIKQYNLNVRSEDKFIPKNYLYSSLNTRKALLQGLLDTDGTIHKKHRSPWTGNEVGGVISFSTVSLKLCEDVEFLCRSLGFTVSRYLSKAKTYIYRYKGVEERRPCKQSYTLYIKCSADSEPFTLSRKKASICDYRFGPRRKIESIEFNRVDECKCIYVESENHTYLTDNLTVTHNTTIARIFADKINNIPDTAIEIDAASNNGVDNIREIIKDAQERSISGKYKIYIIDECHMLTSQSWNAMLKLIEEPPTYTIFIFCTTDPQKIPGTILNRVQRYNFTRISTEGIKSRLKQICIAEHFINFEDSIDYISKIANGGMRDAIAYLDKVSGYSNDLSLKNTLEALGNYSYNDFFDILNNLIDGNEAKLLESLAKYYFAGNDFKIFTDQFFSFILEVAKYAIFKSCDILSIPKAYENQLQSVTNFENPNSYYNYLVNKLLDLKNLCKNDSNIKSTVEAVMLQVARCQ